MLLFVVHVLCSPCDDGLELGGYASPSPVKRAAVQKKIESERASRSSIQNVNADELCVCVSHRRRRRLLRSAKIAYATQRTNGGGVVCCVWPKTEAATS